jgi:hypothetical protein
MATSYISERSAELSLVPQLKMELEKHFNYVAPLFPWLNRETSKISKQVHVNDRFKILVLFPRRPKLDNNDYNKIFATINEDLSLFKEFANEYNVPVIAGCPLATNFWELSKCTKHTWIEINNNTVSNYLNPVCNAPREKIVASLSISRIVKLIKTSATFDIEKFSEFLHESKGTMPGTFIFGPRYKPIYLLIKNR